LNWSAAFRTQRGAEELPAINIAIARQLFFERRYTAIGIADVLMPADANSGGLYHSFRAKKICSWPGLEKYQRSLQPQVLKLAFAHTKDPMKRLSNLEGYRLLLETTDFQLGCPIRNLALKSATARWQGLCWLGAGTPAETNRRESIL